MNEQVNHLMSDHACNPFTGHRFDAAPCMIDGQAGMEYRRSTYHMFMQLIDAYIFFSFFFERNAVDTYI